MASLRSPRAGTAIVLSTPFRWRFARRPPRTVLRLVKSQFIPNPMPPGHVGGGGKHVYTFKAIRRGSTSLQLVLSSVGERSDVAGRVRLRVLPG